MDTFIHRKNVRIRIIFILSLFVVISTLLISAPAFSAEVSQSQPDGQSAENVWLRGVGQPVSDTLTATATQVITHTQTATATATSTATATATATSSSTPTPTLTGTQPTPTATGTITPQPAVSVSVFPVEAKVNQSLTFTIRITNGGTKPTTSGTVSNSFPSYIDVVTVTTSQGTVAKSLHFYTVNIGGIDPNEVVTIIAIVRVNSSLTRTELVSNLVVLVYDDNLTRTGSVIYKVVATTVIPGTGQLSLVEADRLEAIQSRIAWLSSHWALFAFSIGGFLAVAALRKTLFSRAAGVLALLVLAVSLAACLADATSVPLASEPEVDLSTATPTLLPFMPASAFSTPEAMVITLPDYPVPTPAELVIQSEGEPAPDTSSIQRIVIPALGVDTVVAYVPYDEDKLSWLIEGLREEVAWLGDTSWPGLGSNTVLAGHVTVRGLGNGPFRYLDNLQEGDQIKVFTAENEYIYTVREQVTVNETDLGVLLPTTQAQLTLITCTGWDEELEIYRFRRVVFADLLRSEPIVRQGRH